SLQLCAGKIFADSATLFYVAASPPLPRRSMSLVSALASSSIGKGKPQQKKAAPLPVPPLIPSLKQAAIPLS
ncbi:MAG: hypothetical protein OEL57_16590, partial [Trichlorobacter sp.]|uniref:hypothetical protein n=1 Tax=Trichlorobacter sp. TaxID=2911007 RepID=UPI0025679F0B